MVFFAKIYKTGEIWRKEIISVNRKNATTFNVPTTSGTIHTMQAVNPDVCESWIASISAYASSFPAWRG